MKLFHCNCCGIDFVEPDGIYEKLRCPICDAVEDDETIEDMGEQSQIELTDKECNILDQIASKSKMDCWFWIKEKDGGHVIHDLENNEILSLQIGIGQLVEGIVETAAFYGLSEDQVSAFYSLLKRLRIYSETDIFNT